MTIFNKFFLTAVLVLFAGTAQAALKFCNETEYVQSVAIGYKGDSDWTSEGWWNIDPGDCATVVAGNLTKRFYYYRAEVDGGEFSGENFMFCTTPQEFEIVGDSNCESRGYDSEAFREIDTGETATDFTYTLAADESAPRSDDGPVPPDADKVGLEICNSTADVQSVSIGYEGDDGFLSEGWWNIDPDDCALVLAGELQKRYYYYRAEVNGAPFEGEGFMFCTTPEIYTIQGDSDCESRGYDTESFSEIDTGPTARGYTLYITADGAAPPPDTTPDTPPSSGGAGLEICNETDHPQSVSIGYEGAQDWTSEGWWNVDPGQCVLPALDGVNRRYFYYRAEIDGGEFAGQNFFFCTTPEAYVIVGDTECEARGYDREDFAEIDTGGTEGSFTLTLVNADAVNDSTVPEDDRSGVPSGDDAGPSEDTADTPEAPSFDFGLPDENAPDETAPDETAPDQTAPDETVTDTPETDTPPTFDFDSSTPDTTPDQVTPDDVTPPAVDDTPPPAEEPTPIRRGGSRGG